MNLIETDLHSLMEVSTIADFLFIKLKDPLLLCKARIYVLY